MFFAYPPKKTINQYLQTTRYRRSTYLMAGGAPAGIKICPGDEGCRTMITSINIITIRGNNSTSPNGIEIFEFPFKRIRLLKKPRCGAPRSFLGAHSSREAREGRLGDDGILFARFWTRPMIAAQGHPGGNVDKVRKGLILC